MNAFTYALLYLHHRNTTITTMDQSCATAKAFIVRQPFREDSGYIRVEATGDGEKMTDPELAWALNRCNVVYVDVHQKDVWVCVESEERDCVPSVFTESGTNDLVRHTWDGAAHYPRSTLTSKLGSCLTPFPGRPMPKTTLSTRSKYHLLLADCRARSSP